MEAPKGERIPGKQCDWLTHWLTAGSPIPVNHETNPC